MRLKNPLGERIRQERERLEMNQADLAHAIGIAQKSLSEIETGKAQPRAKTVKLIEDALKAPSGSLYYPPDKALKPSRAQLRELISGQYEELTFDLLSHLLERFLRECPKVRAHVLAVLYGDADIAHLNDVADKANSR